MKITFLVSGSIRSNFTYRAFVLARSLSKLGHQVSIIAPCADKYNNFISEKTTDVDGVKIFQPFQFATKRLEINLLPYILGAAYRVIKERPDLVYIYKPTPISVVGLIAKLFYKTPIILDMDDLGSEVMKIEGHPWYQRKLVEWCEKITALYADNIVVASRYLYALYTEKFPLKSIYILPNGVESDWLSLPLPSNHSKRIVFMGSINRKNILEPLFDVLPDIIKKHLDTEVLIIGDGQYLNYFKEKAKTLGLLNTIKFTGWLPIDKARENLFAGDIGYNYMPDEPTTRAASNMKVSQYMSRGVVPLVSEIGDLPAMVDWGKAGYISKADNREALTSTLLLALEDTERLVKSKHAHYFASEHFNWENLASNFYTWLYPNKKHKKQKIYVVATTVPDDVGGGEIRNYNLIKQLNKRIDADIEVFSITSKNRETVSKKLEAKTNTKAWIVSERPRSFMSMIQAIILKRIPPFMDDFKSSGIGDVFRTACEKSMPDIVQIEQIHAYYCIQQHISWLKQNGVKIVFDCHNIEYQAFNDSLELFSFPKRLVGKFLTPRLKKLEIEAARHADIILVCSLPNATFFKSYNSHTYLIPNGVDCSEFISTPKDQSPTLIFMGGVKYPPNGDAVEFYLKEIHPSVKKIIPHIQLLAIGTDSEWLTSKGIDDQSVQPLGFVDDVRPYLNQALVGICPVRYGSGTRIKIMTYMAAGLPVVSTSKGAEGVEYSNEENIILADDSETFAHSLVKLLNDQSYREKIGNNGRNFILENYDWNVIGKKLTSIYHNDK